MRTACCLLLTIVTLAASAAAHGGQYRGPSGALPPGVGAPSGGGGTSGGGSPSNPGSGSGGSAAADSGGAASARPTIAPAPSTSRGGAPGTFATALEDDPTQWTLFWEFRKDSILAVREAVENAGPPRHGDAWFLGAGAARDTQRPSDAQIAAVILPALHRTLETVPQRDVQSACLVALAKIGRDAPAHPLLPALRARLTSHDQEIRETAALALGISQRIDAVPDLAALALDMARGRELTGRTEVDERTRAFAVYGLGLVAYAPTAGVGAKRTALQVFAALLADRERPSLLLPVAALDAIGMLRPHAIAEPGAAAALCREALAVIAAYQDADLGVGRQLAQAHCAPAAAEVLVGSSDRDLVVAWQRRIARDLQGDGPGDALQHPRVQSAVLALARLAAPNDPASPDAWVSEAILATHHRHRDHQTRYFALTALGRIGGSTNRAALLTELRDGLTALEKPWAALALGLAEHERRSADRDTGTDRALVAALRHELDRVQNPGARAAIALAIGLCGADEESDRLRELLVQHAHQDELAGYLSIALGLLGDLRSSDLLRRLVDESERRPLRLLQAAVALGRLGDRHAALHLLDRMNASTQNVAVMGSLAQAIGMIGDHRVVDGLVDMVADESLPSLSRAFAVVALGGVADKELEPWNAKIGRLVNYRAAVETLTNTVSGILDIF